MRRDMALSFRYVVLAYTEFDGHWVSVVEDPGLDQTRHLRGADQEDDFEAAMRRAGHWTSGATCDPFQSVHCDWCDYAFPEIVAWAESQWQQGQPFLS